MAPAARVSGQDRGAYPPPCRIDEIQTVAVPTHAHTENLDASARGLQRRANGRGRRPPHLLELALRPQRTRMVRLGRVDGHAELATAQVDNNGFGARLADVYAQECACHPLQPPTCRCVPCARRASHMAYGHRPPPRVVARRVPRDEVQRAATGHVRLRPGPWEKAGRRPGEGREKAGEGIVVRGEERSIRGLDVPYSEVYLQTWLCVALPRKRSTPVVSTWQTPDDVIVKLLESKLAPAPSTQMAQVSL